MIFDRNLWSENYLEDKWPRWHCPHCNSSSLDLDPKSYKKNELALSREKSYDPDWEMWWYKGSFTANLQCVNTSCRETVIISGEVRQEEMDLIQNGKHYMELKDRIYPKFCLPPLKLFIIDDNIPWDIEDAIIAMFSLFWIDKSACGNSIRKIVELILDDKKVRKTRPQKSGKKRSYYSLAERINLFKDKNIDVARTLMAIKWIGNRGSHELELDNEKLLDGIELLEFALSQLYGVHHCRMNALSDAINKRKGR